MAKCPVCNSKKGKRKCLLLNKAVCSLCCAEIREENSCKECRFYKKAKINYRELPQYSIQEMSNYDNLTGYSLTIESALNSYNNSKNRDLKDRDAFKILEYLINYYYFGENIDSNNENILGGFKFLKSAIDEELSHIDSKIISKVLVTILFVARRRGKDGSGIIYLNLIHFFTE